VFSQAVCGYKGYINSENLKSRLETFFCVGLQEKKECGFLELGDFRVSKRNVFSKEGRA